MKIYMIGICGTGMASLAGMLQARGHRVSGSDQNVYPPMSTLLQTWGIPVQTPYTEEHVQDDVDLVIIGNAISRGNPEAERVLGKNIPYLSMPQAIARFFLADKVPLVVAGTHGKTTTASLLAWVLEYAKKDPSFFIGGLPKNFNSNFKLGTGEFFVLEGDEYDTAFFDKGPKFLHYRPQHLLLTSVEFDHADIYSDLKQVQQAFRSLLQLLPARGTLVANVDFVALRELLEEFSVPVQTYSLRHRQADYVGDILSSGDVTRFCIEAHEKDYSVSRHELVWSLAGAHNVSNALGVVALCRRLGLDWDVIHEALTSFMGVQRRQEVFAQKRGVLFVDDFAHHPTAVRETIAALRQKYPERRLWAVFEPRSNSSKRDVFQDDYPLSFGAADCVLLADVFMPEKVKDKKVLDVKKLACQVNELSRSIKARHIGKVEDIVEVLKAETRERDVVLFMSNGGFGGIKQKVLAAFE